MKILPAAAFAALITVALGLGSCTDADNRDRQSAANSGNTHEAGNAQEVMSRADANCPRTQVADRFKAAVLASHGQIEPIHTSDGLAVLATTENPQDIERVRAAAQSYLRESRQLDAAATSNAEMSASCREILGAVEAGTVRESAAETEKGVLLSISTTDTRMSGLLQRDNCCQFCVCPSTNHRCAGCC